MVVMPMAGRPSLFRSTLMLTGVGVASQFFGFLYRIAMARLAGAEVLGLYQLILPAYAVIQSVCISGLAVAVSVLSAEFYARGNHAALGQSVSAGLRGMAALWLPLAAAVVFRSEWIAVHLLGDVRTRLGLLLLPPVMLLTGVENLQKQQFYGIGSMRLPAGVELGEQVLRSACIILLLAVLGPERPEQAAALIVLGLLLSELFSSGVLTAARLHRARRGSGGVRVPPGQLRRRLCAIALPVSCTALAGSLMGAATSVLIPQLLVRHGLSAERAMEEFGILMGMTLPLLMIPTAFVNALSLALLPRLTRERSLGQMGAFRRTGEKAMLAVCYVVLPLIALIAALGPDLGALLFAEPRAGRYILPLAVGVGAGCCHAALGCILNALGKQSQSAAVSLFCGSLELLATVVLVPRLGMAGFAAAFVGTGLLECALCLLLVWRYAGMHLDCYRCFSAPVLAALLAALLVHLGYHLCRDAGLGTVWAVAGGITAGLGVYWCAMAAQGVRPLWVIRSP